MIADLFLWIVLLASFMVLVPFLWHRLVETAEGISKDLDRQRISMAPGCVAKILLITSAVVGLALLVFLRSFVAGGMGVLLVWLMPGWIVDVIQAHRRRLFSQQFVDVLILMANSMRAGFNLNQTLEIVAAEMPQPAKTEFSLIVRQCNLGASLDVALEDMASRMKSESVTIFVTALLVTRRTGGDLTKMLDKLVKTIRDRERIEDRIYTMTAEGRGQGYVIAALPFLILAARYITNPEGVMRLFNTGWGLAIVIVGTAFDVFGLLAVRKMATVKV